MISPPLCRPHRSSRRGTRNHVIRRSADITV